MCGLATATGTVTGKSHGPMGNIARTGPLSFDVIVTTTDDRITTGTMTGTMTAKSSSIAEANVTVERRKLRKSPGKPGLFSIEKSHKSQRLIRGDAVHGAR